MTSGNGIFRDFQRAHRPLSTYLQQTFAAPSLQSIWRYVSEELAKPTDDIVRALISELRVDSPQLQGSEFTHSVSGGGEWLPGNERGVRISTNRHHVAIQVSGDIGLLEYWPDQTRTDLRPVDAFDVDPWGEDEDNAPYDEEAAVLRHHQRQAQKLWWIGHKSPGGPLALRTFIDLTDDEERGVAEGRFDARPIVDRRRAAIEPIVAAIAEQTKTYFDVQLPAVLAEAIDERRVAVRARAAVQTNLTWPVGWKQDEPKLVDREIDRTEEDLVFVSIEHRCRLDPATFEDIQRTIRVWADAVERYPSAFRGLHEDRLSDLLTATLNASLPGANREVYSRGGRSDIFIRANVLDEGYSPAKIFICESKWWGGPKVAMRALRQLLKYLEAKDTSAILLFFVRTQRPAAVRPKARAALSEHTGYDGTSPEAVEGWPILRFKDQRQHVAVCVGFIDLPAV